MPIATAYNNLKAAAKLNMGSHETREALKTVILRSLEYTEDKAIVQLVSKVGGKTYGMMVHNDLTSRAINTGLYRRNMPADQLLSAIFDPAPDTAPEYLDKCLYTAAMSFPLAADLLGAGNKKSPGTYFEIFVAHVLSHKFGVNPTTSVTVPTLNMEHTIPTDFIFEIAPERRLHVPVKISTRERVVQVWAHQKLLDGMHGAGRFKGVLVCLAETNKQKDISVVEVCLPGQWAAYQLYIAHLTRVYYLDPPTKYLQLREQFPHIQVWPFSKFFQEAQAMLNPAWS